MEEETDRSHSVIIDHLPEVLRPIREASAAWDIPLSDYLESFLQNLTGVDFHNDFRPEMLNFSQAGLFILGSTNIYAKKVNHLHDLALNCSSASFDGINNDSSTSHAKRKRKEVEWTRDNQLIDIEDPPLLDEMKTVDDDSQVNPKITTMPKLPFCLLNSLDPTSTNDQTSYKICANPDDDYGIILLDKSQKLNDLPEISRHLFNSNQIPEFENERRNEEEEEKEKENHSNEEEEKSETLPSPQLPNNNIHNIPEQIPPPALPSSDDEYGDDENDKITFLDPDSISNEVKKFMRPMEKMEKFKVPHSFNDKKSKETTVRKLFHMDIFQELYQHVKEFRKEENDTRKISQLANIPEESGRDHLLQDADAYLYDDFPLPPPLFDQDDDNHDSNEMNNNNMDENNSTEINIDDLPPPSEKVQSMDEYLYKKLLKKMIDEMVTSGKRAVNISEQNQKLTEWENKIVPILDDDLKRGEFKIEECEQWVVDIVKSHDGEMKFQQLKINLQQHEISRVFLSILVLANQGKVIIENEGSILGGDGNEEENFTIKIGPQA
ncbi:hypothetical protein TRFO_24654 [Tritrichomonas foetus]|uniref:Condensin-2 complex subunit H2 C-terminal domain-containing protein n=1 Tax=Tritrichomonas foetus TaxID=1144522 RepID=A0A1J4K784_9EUKA|nr:hypothetical protein TRFO_24654 [Tritrichomonas foetus]|eukprot:OHT07247.1 hypothetical protein TRFO_24654 [Tritrichomonas foetus]